MTGEEPAQADGVAKPPIQVLQTVLAALSNAGIVAAIGGSGLLAALGLTSRVRDWDITTDASPQAVKAALAAAGIPCTPQPSGDGTYASRARLCVDGCDHDIDIIVRFAIRTGETVHELPTRITGEWLGLPLADPAVWAHAYHLMGRPGPAVALDAWLANQS
ncbi:MAG TPA: hypothetical protein VGS19_01705 [Streptosporangiaceae bacterium]|nr:hypothetical protein [Streptosporangiaceae bacterium]